MINETNIPQEWLKSEAEGLKSNLPNTFEQLPSLKLVEVPKIERFI